MRWQIDSPRPVPTPAALVVTKGAKSRLRTSGGMPWPVSRISTTTRPSASSAVAMPISLSSMRPSGIAWAAFTMRFRKTWPSRDALAVTGGTSPNEVVTRQRWRISVRAMRSDDSMMLRTSTTARSSLPERAKSFMSTAMSRMRSADSWASRSCSTMSPSNGARADVLLQRRQVLERQHQVAEHGVQGVVDLVRHAGREEPHRRHAVGDQELLLHRPPARAGSRSRAARARWPAPAGPGCPWRGSRGRRRAAPRRPRPRRSSPR